MQFQIEGRIKPYVRMTRNGKWKNAEAQEYLASQKSIGLQVRRQMADRDLIMFPKAPLIIEAVIIVPKRLYTFDIDNAGKAIIDALQGIVFKNDLWIVEAHFIKKLGDDYLTTISITMDIKP